MTDDPLRSVRLKLRRAEKHLAELQALINATTPADVIRVVHEHDRKTGWHSLRVQPIADLPEDWSTVLADYATNLQTALNYLVRELVIANNRTPERNNKFVVFPRPPEKDWFRNAFRDVHPDARAKIKDLQPYLRPDRPEPEPLEIVSAFGNVERHRAPHGTLVLFAPFDYRGVRFTPKQNVTAASPPRISLNAGAPVGGAQLIALQFAPPDAEVEMEMNGRLEVQVAFGDPPIPMPRIERLIDDVIGVIDGLSPFIINPPPPA